MFGSNSNRDSKVIDERRDEVATVFRISQKSVINGNVSTNEPAVIGGTIEGSVSVENSLVLKKEAAIRGPVFCQNADISGAINGNLTCKGSVVLHAQAALTGDVQCTSLILEKGAYFCGKVICVETTSEQAGAPVEDGANTAINPEQ